MALPNIGPMELIIILIIVLLIFGAGRLAGVGGALGKAIRDFKLATRGEDIGEDTEPEKPEVETHSADPSARSCEG